MRKKSIAVLLILVTLILVISSISFATELNNQVPANTTQDVQNATSNTVTNDIGNVAQDITNQISDGDLVEGIEDIIKPNYDDQVMPISDELEISEDGTFRGEWIENDVYLFDQEISYNKSVDGNVYAMGRKVNINSNMISGNLFVMAEEVIIEADVSGSLYVFANNVEVKGGANDAYIAGNKVVFDENSYVYRDLRAASDTLDIKGCIYRNVYSAAKNINIANNGIARVLGTIYYEGNLNGANEYQVGNTVKIETPVKEKSVVSETTSNIITILSKIVTALVVIGLATIITKNNETRKENRNYIVDALIGVGLIVLIPAIAAVCMLTVVGIPVAMLLVLVYILMLFFSMYAAALDISKIVMNGNSNLIKFVVAVIIYIAFKLVGMIPVGGGIITFVIMAYGFKVILRAIFPKKQINNKEKEPEVVSE